MTEQEWLECGDPQRLLQLLASANVRKDRLVAVACLRQEPSWEPAHARTIEFLEQWAEGTETREASQLAVANARRAIFTDSVRDEGHLVAVMLYRVLASRKAAHHALHAIDGRENWQDKQEPFCGLIRDIFGNPFHPVPLDPSWLTSTVRSLAQGIYDERAFDRLPILADALMDADCDNAEILGHCRGVVPHVRGCWALDLLLGKD